MGATGYPGAQQYTFLDYAQNNLKNAQNFEAQAIPQLSRYSLNVSTNYISTQVSLVPSNFRVTLKNELKKLD
jgi:hypothetical protein